MTTIHTEAFRRIEADETGFSVTCTASNTALEVFLNSDERRALADALDPGRPVAAPAGGQWTRADLPTEFDDSRRPSLKWHPSPELMSDLAAWLNAHHPKPEPDKWRAEWVAVSEDLKAARQREDLADEQWKKWEGQARRAERERDEALRKKGEAFDRAVRAERERDEWKARAEAAGREREKIADQFATFRAEIVAEAVKARKSAVTRADIDRALIDVTSNAMNYPTPSQMLGKDTGPLRRKCVDAMCDLLGIEAEQVVDPVESKARELYRAVMPDARWETVADEYRRIAAHVLEQEASSDE